MLVCRYRLHSSRDIQCDIYEEQVSEGQVVVRPLMWSICKADLRYYFGERDPKILKNKLPLALIHESIGEIVYTSESNLRVGSKVVLIPNESDLEVNYTNYFYQSRFYASNIDGFMRELVVINSKNVMDVSELAVTLANREVLCMSELLSVSLHAMRRVNLNTLDSSHVKIGVWGDGVVGFLTALIIKRRFPQAELVVFGKYPDNLNRFSFADQAINIAESYNEFNSFDFCFECVGGVGASLAINQIIDMAKPCSKIALLGVSEGLVAMNSRMILEKGLELIGSSRSEYQDFALVKKFLQDNPQVFSTISTIIANRVQFNSINDIHKAFMFDKATRFGKTIINL